MSVAFIKPPKWYIMRRIMLMTAIVLGCVADRVSASFLVTFSGPQPSFEIGSSGLVTGFEFTPQVNITVNSLGWNDLGSTPNSGPDGFLAPHLVGIYRLSDHALLTSVTLPAGTAAPLTDGFFRYGDVAPLTLTAGTTYVLAGTTNGYVGNSSVNEPTQNRTLGSEALINPSFTTGAWREGLTNNPSALEFPSFVLVANPSVLAFGPNLQFSVVPEPSSLCLMGLGASALLACVARRSTRAA